MQKDCWQVNSNKRLSGFYKPHVPCLQPLHAWAWRQRRRSTQRNQHRDKLPRWARAWGPLWGSQGKPGIASRDVISAQMNRVPPESLHHSWVSRNSPSLTAASLTAASLTPASLTPASRPFLGEDPAPERFLENRVQQGSANIFCKEPNSKDVRLCRPYTLCHTAQCCLVAPKHQQTMDTHDWFQ